MNKTVLLTKEEVLEALTYPELIQALEKGFSELTEGTLKTLPRASLFHESGNIFAQMPASIPSLGVAGTKTAMFPGPGKQATAQSAIILFDTESGALKSIVSAEPITVLRTAASSAAATNVLARPDAEVLCLLGAGNQAIAHAEAICAIRPIKKINVWSIDESFTNNCVEKISEKFPEATVLPFDEAKDAVADADVICTVTKAKDPILFGEWIKPGAHVNAVGAIAPFARELSSSVLTCGKVYVDQKETCLKSAGDILIPVKAGEYSIDQVIGELGEVINGVCPGREAGDTETITVFESLGIGFQDVIAAYCALQNAEPKNTIEL